MKGAYSRSRRLLLLAALALSLALFMGASRPQASAAATAGLDWQACGRFDCATLSVPLDYAAPNGRHIDLALIRQRAKDPSKRIGSLVVNPGGPGGSGVDFLQSWAPGLPQSIQDSFDIVSFDPRGVGKSTPLDCGVDTATFQALAGLDPDPTTAAGWAQIDAATKAYADACAAHGGDLLPHIGTLDVARDLDQIRAAIGDDKLTYFGYSYGTVIGAVYADMFPTHIRAMVLDGAVDVGISADDLAQGQAVGFETALQHFAADCKAKSCLSDNQDPVAVAKQLLAQTEKTPLPAPHADRPAGAGETMLGIIVTLYSKQSWPALAAALQAALDGDGSELVRLADVYLGREPNGSYDNELEVNAAVNCLDYVSSRDPQHYEDLTASFAKQAPIFGSAVGQGGLVCAYWTPSPQPLTPVKALGAPPIVVVGTTADPATPYAWAVSLSKELTSGVLLTNNGEGHTAYRSGSNCIDDAVDTYLLQLQPPAQGTACGAPAPAPAAAGAPPSTGAPASVDNPTSSGAGTSLLLIGVLMAALTLASLSWLRQAD